MAALSLPEASAELKTLAELTDAPVSCSLMGQGAYDETDRRYIGMLGMHGTVKAAYALNNCDLFIGIGTRFSDRVTGDTSVFGKQAKIIHIDIDPAEFNKNIDVDVTVSGDVKAVLSALNAKIAQQIPPGVVRGGTRRRLRRACSGRHKGASRYT